MTEAHTIDGKEIGIITIPPHEHLIYLKHDYGKLRAKTVYLRQGSSTSIATPDEIIQLRTPVPTLDLQFADVKERAFLGNHLFVRSLVLDTPRQIPDLKAIDELFDGLFNRNYYREFITYATFDQLMKPFGIAITNTSSTTAHDVRITLTMPDAEQRFTLALDAPPKPEQLATTGETKAKKAPKRPITLERTSTAWHLSASIPKVQPRQTHYLREQIYIGATTTMTLNVTATMHADNLPEPITTSLTIDITTTERTATLIEALAIYNLD